MTGDSALSDDARGAGGADGLTPLSAVVILGGAAILLLVTGAALLFLPRGDAWESNATLIIDQPRAIAVSQDPGVIDKLARLRFKYAGIVTTQAFSDFVTDNGEVQAQQLGDAELIATVPPESLLLEVGARGEQDVVTSLADAAADSLIAFVENEHDEASVPDNQRFFLEIVSPADEAERIDPSRRDLALGLLAVGVVMGAVAVVSGRRGWR